MITKTLQVHPGINYISMWDNFENEIQPGHVIINKRVCGCGFTEYYLGHYESIILASPRNSLLQNKYEQHPECFYATPVQNPTKKELASLGIDSKDEAAISKYKFGVFLGRLQEYLNFILVESRRLGYLVPYKFLVTYDSFPKLI